MSKRSKVVGKVRAWEPGKIGGGGYNSWERKEQEVGVLKGWEEGEIEEIMQLLSLMMLTKGCGVYYSCPYHKAFQSPCKAVAVLVMSFPSK